MLVIFSWTAKPRATVTKLKRTTDAVIVQWPYRTTGSSYTLPNSHMFTVGLLIHQLTAGSGYCTVAELHHMIKLYVPQFPYIYSGPTHSPVHGGVLACKPMFTVVVLDIHSAPGCHVFAICYW